MARARGNKREKAKIEYENNVDWEFLLNHTPHYYIQWTHCIIKCNGELINDFVEVERAPQKEERNGIELPTYDKRYKAVTGEYGGHWLYLQNGTPIKNKKYINPDYICAVDLDK